MNRAVIPKRAVIILLAVNIVLLIGTTLILLSILLEESPDLYARLYYVTLPLQPFIIHSWFLALVLGPLLAVIFSIRFGREIRKTIEWKISMVIMMIAGLPSLAFVLLGFMMHGFS